MMNMHIRVLVSTNIVYVQFVSASIFQASTLFLSPLDWAATGFSADENAGGPKIDNNTGRRIRPWEFI